MLRIRKLEAEEEVVFALSGKIDEEDVAELETLISSEPKGRRVVLDLADVTLVARDAIGFLEHLEATGSALRNCPRYVRELITRQRRGS
jgi:anti-anti-sigma regulatory factor